VTIVAYIFGIEVLPPLCKFQMQINVFTFFVVLYASTQIKANTFFCRCATNGVVFADSTQACCVSPGGIFGTV
jgi:hypothetical protein